MTNHLELALRQRAQTEPAEEWEPAEALQAAVNVLLSLDGGKDAVGSGSRGEELQMITAWNRGRAWWAGRSARPTGENTTDFMFRRGSESTSEPAPRRGSEVGNTTLFQGVTPAEGAVLSEQEGTSEVLAQALRRGAEAVTLLRSATETATVKALSEGAERAVTGETEGHGGLLRAGALSALDGVPLTAVVGQTEGVALSPVLAGDGGTSLPIAGTGSAHAVGLLRQVERAERGYAFVQRGGSAPKAAFAEERSGEVPLTVTALDRAVERDARRYGGDFSLM